jgi:hypothetical protein
MHCGLAGSSEEGNDSHASLPENLGNFRQTLRAADSGVLGSRGDGWVVGGAWQYQNTLPVTHAMVSTSAQNMR